MIGTAVEQSVSVSGGRQSRKRDVGERRAIEMCNKGGFGGTQACLETAAAGDGAVAPICRETFHQRLALFQEPRDIAQSELL